MKLLYQKPKYLRYAKRKQKRLLRRRRSRRRKQKTQSAVAVQEALHNRTLKLPPLHIRVPTRFSIVDNTDETLGFFRTFQKCIISRRSVSLDMSGCSELDMGALLYILSLFDYYRLKQIPCRVRGNVPEDKKCLALLMSSGFFQHVYSRMPQSAPDRHVFRIASAALTHPQTAREIIDFSLKHLNQRISEKSKAIYRILIEMMNNTREHAFVRQTETSKWHVMAVHDDQSGAVRFAFLDGGQGVPSTILKKHRELVTRWAEPMLTKLPGVRDISAVRDIDARLLMSALQGDILRSKTEKEYRGKGMPEIYGLAGAGHVGNLRLVSGKGFVDCTKKLAVGLGSTFQGTLYTWDFL